jgi:hypothetical protein
MDIPPWIRGTGAVYGPMVKGGNFIWFLNYRNMKTLCRGSGPKYSDSTVIVTILIIKQKMDFQNK